MSLQHKYAVLQPAVAKRYPRITVASLLREYAALREYSTGGAKDGKPVPPAKAAFLRNGLAGLTRAGRAKELPAPLRELLSELVAVARATGNRAWLRKLGIGAERGTHALGTAEHEMLLAVIKLWYEGHGKRRIHGILEAQGFRIPWATFRRFLDKNIFV